MKTRIYITEPFRPMNIPMLIEATSAGQASRFVSDQLFAVRPASGLEVAQMMGRGEKVFKAGPYVFGVGEAEDIAAAGSASASPAATGAYLPASKAGEAAQ